MAKDEKSGYYDVGGIETIDIIRAKLTEEQYEGYILGNKLKYLLRCNWKGSFKRDIEKDIIYSSMLKEIQTPKNNKFTIKGNPYKIITGIENKLEKEKNYKVTVEEI